MENKDSIFIGLALGAVVPILGFVAVETLFNTLASMGWIDEGGTGIYSSRTRTIGLLAICFNLIPFNIAKNKRWDNTMRGMIFPTLIERGMF